ncbi:hypothetical protein CPB86DRAFT_872514, partial [Serendipita vermifera]
MEANPSQSTSIYHHDVPQESIFYRIPVEIWYLTLPKATSSSLFPYEESGDDDDSLTLSLSILHNPYLFETYQSVFTLQPLYFDYRTYVNHQRNISRLRQVCRLWNDILTQQALKRYQWMFTNNSNFHYPLRSMSHQRRPQLLVVDESKEDHCLASKLILRGSSRSFYPQFAEGLPPPKFALADHDLSDVRFAILGDVQVNFAEVLGRMTSLRLLSLDAFSRGFPQILDSSDLQRTLTHLHVFAITPTSLMRHQNSLWNFHSLRYLALQFDPVYFDNPFTFDLFPKCKLEQLNCLSITANVQNGAERTLENIFSRLSASHVSELLLDCHWDASSRSISFLEKVRSVCFPQINILGIPYVSLGAAIESLLSTPLIHATDGKDTTSSHPRGLYLFILTESSFGPASTSGSIQESELESLGKAFQARHVERIYLSKYDTQTLSIDCLVEYCLKHGIPIYDVDGCEIYMKRGSSIEADLEDEDWSSLVILPIQNHIDIDMSSILCSTPIY